MSLTTEQVVDVIFKITGVSPGLFSETGSRQVGAIINKTFWCDSEGEEYSVLIKGDKIIEIKNDSACYPQELINHLLSPAQQAPAHTPSQVPPPGIVPTPQFTNLPQIAVTSAQAVSVAMQQLVSDIQQYVAAFVSLNPGCIYTLFDPANPNCVNEAAAALPSAWEISYDDIALDVAAQHQYGSMPEITARATNCTDQSIADQVTATITLDVNLNVIGIEIEG